MLSDDRRTREYASRRGVEAYSSLSLLTTALREGLVSSAEASEVVYSLKSVPVLVPDAMLGQR